MLATGTIVDGRYELVALLGEGGMCSVYKARHRELQRDVALKILHARLLADSTAIARFHREAMAVSRLEHPNIVKVYGFGIFEQAPYMAMEYLDGISLAQLLKSQVRLPPETALPIFWQILDALQHAHVQGVIHRDLKPSNIMLVGPDRSVRVVDFGIAKVLPQSGQEIQRLTQTGELFGTTLYMSPEQCRGEQPDARSDLYSLGCLMYETLDGQPPIRGDTAFVILTKQMSDPPEESEHIPSALSAVIFRCLDKDPEKRPASAEQLKIALLNPQQWADQTPAIARSKKQPTIKLGTPRVAAMAAALVAILLVLILLGWGSWSKKADPEVQQSIAQSLMLAGRRDSHDNHHAEAVTELNEAIRCNPKLAFAYYFRADELGKVGMRREAIKDYDEIIRLGNPYTELYGRYEPYENRASQWDQLNDYAAAVADYNQAINLAPSQTHLYVHRAKVYDEMHQYQKAMDDLETARQQGAEDISFYRQLGITLTHLGRYRDAFDNLTTAITKSTSDIDALESTGKRSLQKENTLGDLHYWRALAARHLHLTDVARKDDEAYHQLLPGGH